MTSSSSVRGRLESRPRCVAQELGANVIALERGQEIGGAAGIRLSGGAFHLAMGSMDLEPEAMLAHINKVTGGEIAPNLARMVADESKPSIEWLATQGIPLKPQGGEHGKFTIDPRGPSTPGRKFNRAASPDRAMRDLHFKFVEKGGVDLLRGQGPVLDPVGRR